MNYIKSVVESLKKKNWGIINNGISIEDYYSFNALLESEGFSFLGEDSYELYNAADGLAFNGVEFYSIMDYPNTDETGRDYHLEDILLKNYWFREYYSGYSEYNSSLVLLGKTDEELLLYDGNLGYYYVSAREDLMVYEKLISIEGLFVEAFSGRLNGLDFVDTYNVLNIETTCSDSIDTNSDVAAIELKEDKSDKNKLDYFSDMFSKLLMDDLNRKNSVKKIPISFVRIEVSKIKYPEIKCNLFVSEPSHIWSVPLKVDFLSKRMLIYSVNNNENERIDLLDYISEQQILELNRCFQTINNDID